MEFRRVLFRATTTLGVKVDEALRERLKIAAVKLGCTPHWLHKQALLAYVEAIERGQLPAEIAHFGQSDAQAEAGRSEEHTSELQSLMRISYAVFCLKKKILSHHYSVFLFIDLFIYLLYLF